MRYDFVQMRRFRVLIFAVAALIATSPFAATAAPAASRDGSHDFDFNVGTWKTHITRIKNPFSPTPEYSKLDGIVRIRNIWGGRAQLEEIEADGATGHWEGLTLFLYNPNAHQWTQTFADSANATFAGGLTGSFAGGRGEFYQQDTLDGRSVLVRGTWSHITANAHRYEEAYSADGGASWKPAFIGTLNRARPGDRGQSSMSERSHAFDFDMGMWHTQSMRLLHPLTGSKTWTQLDGSTNVTPVWDGRANLALFKARGPSGALELLALRMYNPVTHQWSINFATPNSGTLSVTALGDPKNGRITFYDQEPLNGHAVLVRFAIWPLTTDTARSEQAFSDDGGKTWEVNWINRYTRARTAGSAKA